MKKQTLGRAALIALALCLGGAGLSIGQATAKPLGDNQVVISGEFVRDRSFNLTGYYFPMTEIQVGSFHLDHIDMGDDSDFRKQETEGQILPTWTPFEFSFSDMSSPELQGEMGPYRERSPRVFCKSYTLTADRISFTGYDKNVGEVRFEGEIDPAFITQQSTDATWMSESEGAVITGDLTIAGKTFKNVAFAYWAGD